MNAATKKQLLSNPQAVDEIKRHLWIESEKVGYDIGFETAAEDWLSKYADNWVEQYMPKVKPRKTLKTSEPKPKTPARKRSAKTYF